MASQGRARAADAPEAKAVHSEVDKHHDEAVHRLQEWIRQPSIAAENRGMTEGCDMTMRFLRDAGFDAGAKNPQRWAAGDFRDIGRGRASNFWPLLHV